MLRTEIGIKKYLDMGSLRDYRIFVAEMLMEENETKLNKCNPYGYVDCDKFYDNLMYWNSVLDDLKKEDEL